MVRPGGDWVKSGRGILIPKAAVPSLATSSDVADYSDLGQAARAVGGLTIRIIDSLPLPVLIVLFFSCMALVFWPLSRPASLLPSHHGSPSDKSRLSPTDPEKPYPYPLTFPYPPPVLARTTSHGSPPLGGVKNRSNSPPRYASSPDPGRGGWVPRRGSSKAPMLGWRGGLGCLEERDEKAEV